MYNGFVKKVDYLISVLFLLIPSTLFSLELSGIVMTENNDPVADSTVIILELDIIEVSDTEGKFRFSDIEEGNYTLLVMAPGFQDKEFSNILPRERLTLVLVPEVVEMDTITVKAVPEAIEKINEGVTAEELERQPAGSDPFDAVIMEEGILGNLNIMTAVAGNQNVSNYTESEAALILPEGRMSKTSYDSTSVYGGESDWNNYYYDYIRMPSNKHVFGYPTAEAVIPVEAVDSIDIYRGAYPVEYGPGIGGCFVLNPLDMSDEWSVELTPSTSQIAGISTIRFTDDISLLASMNQSILNLTTVPLINLLMEISSEEDLNDEGPPTSINYGDALLSLQITPLNHIVSVDFIGFYDSWGFDLSVRESYFKMNNVPYFLAAGSKWIWSITPEIGNKIYVFGSLYRDTGFFAYDFRGEAFDYNISTYNQEWTTDVKSVQAGEELQFLLFPELALLFGASGRASVLLGTVTDEQHVEDSSATILADYEHDVLFEDFLGSVYGYTKLLGNIDDFDYHLGAGCLWYPETMNFRPAVEGEAVYSLESASFALTSGWSPGIIDEYTFTDRRLDELYYEMETETIADKPPMTVTGAGQAVFLPDIDSSLKLSPYYSWYYDLTGLSLNTAYTDLDSTFISLEPSRGYSTGIDIKWSDKPAVFIKYDLSYAFSLTRYYTEEFGWIAPNNEVQHSLKAGATYEKDGFSAGLNFLLYSGQPFTPEIVEINGNETTVVSGDYNSAYNYIPKYELSVNLKWEEQFDNFSFIIFFNSSNLIDGLNFTMFGLKESVTNTEGASSADFSSREYIYDYTVTDLLITLLMCELGFSISF